MTEKICYNCFHEKTQDGVCPVCGYSAEQDRDKYPLALPHGTILNGKYILGRVLGQGGFGITYVAQDWKTKKRVAVKEYLPDTMATRIEGHTVSAYSGQREESFSYGKECFLSEAKTLAEFIGNENIVRIHSYFEENGTAYFVMEYVDGVSFQNYIKDQGGKIDWQDAGRILFPIMDALGAVHAKGIIHRDVTPDNIFITEEGTVKLLDFGAARYSLGDRSRSLDVVLKHGYAPKEQYTRRGRQGAYTDVYSVAACFYFAVTGRKPPDSIERMDEDDLIPPSSLGVKVSEVQEDALLKGLSVQAADRYQNMADFKAAMTAGEETESVANDISAGDGGLLAGSRSTQQSGESDGTKKESQSQSYEKNEPRKESGISDTPKAGVKLPEIAAGLRERKLLIPMTVAAVALIVVVAAVTIGVQSSHRKPAGDTDSVLVDADSGTLKTNGKAGLAETGANDIVEAPEEVVYLVTKHIRRDIEHDSETEYTYSYDEQGNCLTESSKDKWASTKTVYTYDAAGNELTYRHEYDGVLSSSGEYTYDADGNKLTHTDTGSEYTLAVSEQYVYDTAGNLLQSITYRGDEKLQEEYTYDADGNKLTQTSYKGDGIISEKCMYCYDAAGNELSCTKYDADDKISNKWEYTYDENGKVRTENFYSSLFSEELRLAIREEYTYDEAGNTLLHIYTHYRDNGETKVEETVYTYDEHGNMLSVDGYDYDGRREIKKYSYVYDEYGNILEKTTYDGRNNDKLLEIDEYEYITITKQGG